MTNSYVNDFTDTVKQYYKNIKKYNPMSKEEEKELIHRAKNNDLNARNQLLTSNLKFVFNIAKNYKGYGASMEDLISEGNMGLSKAFDKFDEKQDVKFISYAVWWIKYYIQDYLQTKGCERQHEFSEDELMQPHIENGIIDDEDEKLIVSDTILGDGSDVVEKEKNHEQKLLISHLLTKLDDRERKIIECYFGLKTGKHMTLEEISDILGISKERCRQIKSKSLLKLKSEILLFS